MTTSDMQTLASRLLAAFSVCFLLFSCTVKEDYKDEPLPEGDYRDVTAYAPNAYPAAKASMATLVGNNQYMDEAMLDEWETKSELKDDGVTVLWNPGDYLCAFKTKEYGYGDCWADNQNPESSSTARFFVDNAKYSYAFSMGGDSQMKSDDYSLSGNVLTVSGGFPATQTLKAGSFGRGANLVVADAHENTGWQFHNAGALVAVRLAPESGNSISIQKIELENRWENGYFAGDAQVTINGGDTSSSLVENSNRSRKVTLSSDNAVSIDSATDFYFVVPQGTYGSTNAGQGLQLTISLGDGRVFVFKNDHQLSLSRNDNLLIANIKIGAIAGSEKIFDDQMQNGWTLSGTTDKYSITTEQHYAGTSSIKWTVDDSGSWARTLTLTPNTTPKDVSTYTAIRFKMKLVNSSVTTKTTFARLNA